MCTTVDDHVDKSAFEHLFLALTWGFPFHTMCGEPWLKYTLKVPIHGDLTV